MDYLDDAPESDALQPLSAQTDSVSSGDVDPETAPASVHVRENVDPLLAELLSDDRNLRRRVVGALLRAVLADRRVT